LGDRGRAGPDDRETLAATAAVEDQAAEHGPATRIVWVGDKIHKDGVTKQAACGLGFQRCLGLVEDLLCNFDDTTNEIAIAESITEPIPERQYSDTVSRR
jgi:hypothetical protein